MRFTIRDMLWFMVALGLSIGWLTERSRLAKQRDEFEAKALEAEGNFISLSEIMRQWGVTVEKSPGGLSLEMTEFNPTPTGPPK